MSFLSRLGLKPVSFQENNHGELEQFNHDTKSKNIQPVITISPVATVIATARPVSLTIEVPSVITMDEGHDTPDTAIGMLQIGANQFSSSRIIIAKGFIASIHIERKNIITLFLLSPKGETKQVAQIMCDDDLGFANPKQLKRKPPEVWLIHGVYPLLPDSEGDFDREYYFLSRGVF